MEDLLDMQARRGPYSRIPLPTNGRDPRAPHDSFAFMNDQNGTKWSLTYASEKSKAETEKVADADFAPGGAHVEQAAQNFVANAQLQQQQQQQHQ